jgi:hypothetical protein
MHFITWPVPYWSAAGQAIPGVPPRNGSSGKESTAIRVEQRAIRVERAVLDGEGDLIPLAIVSPMEMGHDRL